MIVLWNDGAWVIPEICYRRSISGLQDIVKDRNQFIVI